MTYFICRIPFGTSELKIKTLKEIDNSDAEEISYFVNTFYNELNPNIANSSAYTFNHGQIGIPLFIKKEYLEFLAQHMQLVELTDQQYQPFTISNPQDISNSLSIDRKSNSVIKNIPVTLESTINRKHFTIDILSDYLLSEKKLRDFLITSDSIFLARGSHIWAIDIGHHIQDDFTLEINNESIVIEPVEAQSVKNRFGLMDEVDPIEYVFIQGSYSNLPKIIGSFAKNINSHGGLRQLAGKYGIIIHALDKAEKLTTFNPN